MRDGIETRNNGVVIKRLSNGMYEVLAGCRWSYIQLKHARKYADSLPPVVTTRD